jgi:hypothetical protein
MLIAFVKKRLPFAADFMYFSCFENPIAGMGDA